MEQNFGRLVHDLIKHMIGDRTVLKGQEEGWEMGKTFQLQASHASQEGLLQKLCCTEGWEEFGLVCVRAQGVRRFFLLPACQDVAQRPEARPPAE